MGIVGIGDGDGDSGDRLMGIPALAGLIKWSCLTEAVSK